jgi:hypothetical protein
MDHDVTHLPKPLQRLLRREDIRFGVAISWALGLSLAPLAGFYFGTIAGSPHVVDLQVADMENGLRGAGIGLLIGVGMALATTILYPTYKEREELIEDEANFGGGHH